MYKLKKISPPFGTEEMPIMESSYSEGMLKVINGICEVKFPETRDRLVKLGYIDITQTVQIPIKNSKRAKKRR